MSGSEVETDNTDAKYVEDAARQTDREDNATFSKQWMQVAHPSVLITCQEQQRRTKNLQTMDLQVEVAMPSHQLSENI